MTDLNDQQCNWCGKDLIEIPTVDETTGRTISTELGCPSCLDDIHAKDATPMADGKMTGDGRTIAASPEQQWRDRVRLTRERGDRGYN